MTGVVSTWAGRPVMPMDASGVVWHDVECGAYAADLPLWEELAGERGGPVLELGAGTGRVALHLARRGHEVWALDGDPSLLAALEARGDGLPVHAVRGDARALAIETSFPLVLAPMQFLHLLGGASGRRAVLERVRACLAPGGLFAAAVVEGVPADSLGDDPGPPPLPDVIERDGRVYSSLPLGAGVVNGRLEVRRLRQEVSPDGTLTESEHVDRLDVLDLDGLEAEARACGLAAAGRREVAGGVAHVGSTVVMLEAR